MKYFLYGTTALATAGLIAGVAGNASAAERIKIGVHGYHQQFMTVADQDYDVPGENDSTKLVDQKHNSEICFTGESTLDNGITFGLNVQLEANTSSDQIDESYMYVQGDSLGKLILGDENNAGYLLHVTAPNGGVSMDSGDFINIDTWENPGLSYTGAATGTTNLVFGDNDSGKATYITPRFAGVQLGVSFIPEFESGGDDNSSLKGSVNNGWAGGVNYTEDFGGFGVKLSAGYLYGDSGPEQATGIKDDDNLHAYNVGAQFSYAGFAFGGAYNRGLEGAGGNGRINSTSYIVGASYETGPYSVGVNYMRGEENPTANNGKGRLDQLALSGGYQLGPGIRLVGGLVAFDGESEGNADENDGYAGVVGFKLGF